MIALLTTFNCTTMLNLTERLENQLAQFCIILYFMHYDKAINGRGLAGRYLIRAYGNPALIDVLN